MAATSEDDNQTYFILGLGAGIAALVIFLVIGVALYKSSAMRAPASAPAVAAAAAVASPANAAAVAGASGATGGGAAVSSSSVTAPTAGAGAGDKSSAVAEVTQTVTVVVPDGAGIAVENGVVKFYFASGSADLAPGAAEALAAVIKGVEGGQKAVVSGYHDTTGDAARNEELAGQRAKTVRDVLVGLGVPAASIEMRKPAATAGTGNDAQARRVEVKLTN